MSSISTVPSMSSMTYESSTVFSSMTLSEAMGDDNPDDIISDGGTVDDATDAPVIIAVREVSVSMSMR